MPYTMALATAFRLFDTQTRISAKGFSSGSVG